MKVKAIKSFIGKISMDINDEKEIVDKELAEDLIRAGHVVEVKAEKDEAKVEKTVTKKNNRKKK